MDVLRYKVQHCNIYLDIIFKIPVYRTAGCSLDYFKYFTSVMYASKNWKQKFRERVTSVPATVYVKESKGVIVANAEKLPLTLRE